MQQKLNKLKAKVKRAFKKGVWLIGGGYDQKKFWDGWAPAFIDDPWQVEVHPQHSWLLKLVKKNKPATILELGCGFGRNVKYLIDNGVPPSTITGVDISPKMIKLAKRFVKNKKVKLIVASVEGYSPHKKFDFVFTHGVLMHIPSGSVESALKRIVDISNKSLVFIEQNYEADNDYTFTHNYKALLKEQKLDIIEYQNNKKLGLDLIYAKVRKK